MNFDGWEQQAGGLFLAVSPFKKENPEHRDAASSIMRASVRTIAQIHGAEFSNRAFHNNLQALYNGDIRLDFYIAKWEVTEHKPPIYLGAALSWDTIGLDQDGTPRRALYTEDVCLLNGQMRELIRDKPAGKAYPEESLAESLERISLQSLAKQGMTFKYGEVNPDNARMMRAMLNNGGMFGNEIESAVLEFQKLPSGLIDRFPMDVKIVGLRKDGEIDNNNYIARWRHGQHDIRFIVTRGQATATGRHRVDIRPWHNGVLPSPEIMECVVAAALRTIKHEVEVERKWGRQYNAPVSPAVPLLAPAGEICRSIYADAGEELLTVSANKPKSFDLSMPDAHVQIINDKLMLDAFMDVGAVPRLFGRRPMMPGANVLNRVIGMII